MNSAFSMEDDDFDPIELQKVMDASGFDQDLVDQQAIFASLNPYPQGAAEESDDEEELLRKAKELSLQRPPETVSEGIEFQEFLTDRLIRKGKNSSSEAEYLRGLDFHNSAENFIGYLIFLLTKDNAKYRKWIINVDKHIWTEVCAKLHLGKRTANNVFILLDEAKRKILEESRHPKTAAELVTIIDNVLLELLSGK
ncbi:MAG: hypothetical protein K2Q34_01685 [Alphaproteobacteria bacterium]|nr:hypothetical protein [Alphaproteobacteria bacterium]